MATDHLRRNSSQQSLFRIHVWDLPTRLFHWLLVIFVAVSFASGKIGGNAMELHEWSGFAVLALLLFRLGWGFVGGRQSRFKSFVCGPAAVARYAVGVVRGDAPRFLGHNPLGGWSIVAMLITLLVQAVTGLFANDDIFTEGPLYAWVSKDASDWLTRIHRLNQDVIIVLVCVHILAVFFYLWVKRENLIIPMITGKKRWHADRQHSRAGFLPAVVTAALAVALVFLLVR
jgi:cytochrome b